MSNWVRVAALSEIPAGSSRELVADERILALYNVDGELFVLDGICPHQGGPLGKGKLTGCIVTCPWHGWQFNVKTGQHQTTASICHPHYPVKVESGDVFVDLQP